MLVYLVPGEGPVPGLQKIGGLLAVSRILHGSRKDNERGMEEGRD